MKIARLQVQYGYGFIEFALTEWYMLSPFMKQYMCIMSQGPLERSGAEQ